MGNKRLTPTSGKNGPKMFVVVVVVFLYLNLLNLTKNLIQDKLIFVITDKVKIYKTKHSN